MHPLAFQFKHVHLAVVALGRKLFGERQLDPMTPARFDFFYAIYARKEWWAPQREIRRALGLSGATVSKMIKRLTVLGLVRSMVAPNDERQRNIVVTDEGRSLFMRAMTLIFGEGSIERLFTRCAFGDKTPSDQKRSWWKQVLQFEDCFSHVNIFRYAWATHNGVVHKLRWPCVMLYHFKDNPFD
jgi:DNA-binding MarR family transcriptional regulator